MNEDIIYGRNPIIEALEAGRTIDKIFLQDGARHTQIGIIKNLAKKKGVIYRTADKRKLDALTDGENHQGAVAFAAAHKYVEVEDILKAAEEKGESPFIVIADGLSDPHNLGSIIRTANAAGAHGIIIPKNRSISLNSVVAKVSTGAVEYTPVARVTNISQTIDKLKKNGIWVCGTAVDAKQQYYQADLTGPLAIVIGSEGDGMSKLVKQSCDFLVSMPMIGQTQSLNASVAAGILLYESLKQRLTAKK